MTEHQKETAFLRRLMLCDNCAGRRDLEVRLFEAEHDDQVIRRAMTAVALLTALSVAGLSYSMILLPDFPHNRSQLVLKVFLILGLGSSLCMIVYACVWARCRRLLNQLRAECRQVLASVFESRRSHLYAIPFPQTVNDQGLALYHNETLTEDARLPKAI